MIYLAQVEREKLKLPRICLHLEKLPEKIWKSVPATPNRLINLPHQYHHLAAGLLMLVELNDKREVVKVEPALTEIVAVCNNWTKQVLETTKEKAKIDEWRDSLSIQAYELFIRAQDLETKEDKFKAEIATWHRTMLTLKQRNETLSAELELLKNSANPL